MRYHGFSGTKETSAPYGTALAEAGFLVVCRHLMVASFCRWALALLDDHWIVGDVVS
jgi:fermentation-respiration switch protein FrsA (DUF1100 family)